MRAVIPVAALGRRFFAAADPLGTWRRIQLPVTPCIEDLVRPGEHYLALGFQIRQRDHATPALEIAAPTLSA
jgi:hypothetical protein